MSAAGAHPEAAASTWPQWRGPGGLGISPATDLALDWSPTGTIRWKTPILGRVYQGGRVPVPATFTPALVAVSHALPLTSEDGDTFVVAAGPKHEVVRTNSVGGPLYASPAIAGGQIYIRGQCHVFVIGALK